jgi:hypothetical protein
MLSESSSPRHSNFMNAAIARTLASNALNMRRILRQTLPLCILICGRRAGRASPYGNTQHGRNRRGGRKSVRLIPIAADPYIDFEGNR